MPEALCLRSQLQRKKKVEKVGGPHFSRALVGPESLASACSTAQSGFFWFVFGFLFLGFFFCLGNVFCSQVTVKLIKLG